MPDSDAALVARARLGDAAAFDALLRRHFRAAFLVALALTGERADAEDDCQAAFLRSWERLEDCRSPERFAGGLVRSGRNTAHHHRDYPARRRPARLDEAAGVAARASPGASPADDAARAELAARLRAALMRLPATQREIVLLHDLEGWRHREIATTLGTSETMSRRHLSDARRTLRDLL